MEMKQYLKAILVLLFICFCISVTDKKTSAEEVSGEIGPMSVTGSAITYYVGGTGASDANSGLSSTKPFASLDKAVSTIAYDTATIIVQSDIIMNHPVVIKGDVTIKSDGTLREISRNGDYDYNLEYSNIWSMLIVEGSLTLGDSSVADTTTTLWFYGFRTHQLAGWGEIVFVKNTGVLNLYNGVKIGNSNTAGIHNEGLSNMYGGYIYNNNSELAGGVYNSQSGIFNMYGGSIESNQADGGTISGALYGGGAVYNTDSSTFNLIGGIITKNNGCSSGGVFNNPGCTFHMSGGSLVKNQTTDDYIGIFNRLGADCIIEKDADFTWDEIVLEKGSFINVSSNMNTDSITLVTQVIFNSVSKTFDPDFTLGSQIIKCNEGSIMFQLDVSYTSDLVINSEGKINKSISNYSYSLPDGTTYEYTKDVFVPEVIVKNSSIVLQEGIDYEITKLPTYIIGDQILHVKGKGNYTGTLIVKYKIAPTTAKGVITKEPKVTTTAAQHYTVDELSYSMLPKNAEVQIDGGTESLDVSWSHTGGTYDPKGGTYTYIGTIKDSEAVLSGGLTLNATITVAPVIATAPTFDNATIQIVWKGGILTATELGETVLPTIGCFSNSVKVGDDSYNTGDINYKIKWDNQTLNSAYYGAQTTFTGTVTFDNYPDWLTIPEHLTVSRTVGVTGKLEIPVGYDINHSKVYDGKPSFVEGLMIGCPNGKYSILYESTDGKGYSSAIAPKNVGKYKCCITITIDEINYSEYIEDSFEILPKNLVIVVDDKGVCQDEPLPIFTYSYEAGKEFVKGDTFITEPTLSAAGADTNSIKDYIITAQGANAGDNYIIQYKTGVLTVEVPTYYTITSSYGLYGHISPSGMLSVEKYKSQTYSIIPNANYVVNNVLVDNEALGAITSYTFSNVTENHTIQAVFSPIANTPVIPPSPGSGGGFSGGGGFAGGGAGGAGAAGAGGGAGGAGGGIPAGSDEKNATPTPTPPENSVNGSDSIGLIGSNGKAAITIADGKNEGDVDVTFKLPYDDILAQAEQGSSLKHPLDITIPINSEQLIKQMKTEAVQAVNITVTLPSNISGNENIGTISNVLSEELLKTAKDKGKDITVTIADENGKEQYSWSFNGSNMAESNQEIVDINLSLEVDSINNTQLKGLLQNTGEAGSEGSEGEKGLIINFGYHGELPTQASVRVYVGNQEGIKPGDNVLLYYYNSDTDKLESLPYGSGYTVDANGYVTVQILHCSDYVLLTDVPDKRVVTSLINQINVSVTSKVLYFDGTIGNTADYNIKLPSTLEWISKKEKTKSSAIGGVYITFTSRNPNVATIDNKGHIVAKSIGTTVIITKVKLYNGTTKTYKTTITVKEPCIKLVKNKSGMKLGETFTFTAKVFGLEKSDVIWTTTNKNVVSINKKTGIATATSIGTAYIVAKAGDFSVKLKAVVSK